MVTERMIAAAQFERSLREELAAAGVQVVSDFRIKISNNRYFMADFFIPSPQRAIVEVKLMSHQPSQRILNNAINQMQVARQAFEGQVVCFLVLLNGGGRPLDRPIEEDWLSVIEVSGEEAATKAASEIRIRLYGSLPPGRLAMLSSDALTDALPETGALSDVLVNFRTRIPGEAFQLLKLEAENFFREYSSGHYTTSALCVGRMLEFVVYTLARAWRVPINKRTIKLLEDLEGKFSLLSKSIVEYAYAESASEKDKAKNILHEIANFNSNVTSAALSLHEDHEKIDTDYPVNIQSILRDIRKRYAKIETVRKEADLLTGGDLITSVLKMRNRAAHADTSGSRTEYGKRDIDGMLDDLRAILFHLGNIADAIDREAR